MGNVASAVRDGRQPLVEGETLEDRINATRNMSTAEFDAYLINAAAQYNMPDLLPYVLIERTEEDRRAMVQFVNTGTMDGPAGTENEIEKSWPLIYDQNKPEKSSEFAMKIGKALYSGYYTNEVADLFWMAYRCTMIGRNYVVETRSSDLPTGVDIFKVLDVGSLVVAKNFPTAYTCDKMRAVIKIFVIDENGGPDDLTPFGEVLIYVINKHEGDVDADRKYLMQLKKKPQNAKTKAIIALLDHRMINLSRV